MVSKILYVDNNGSMDLPLFNTFVGGISGHGKSEFMKSYVCQLSIERPDLKVLIIDSTDDQEYRELGRSIPLCFVDITDPFVLKELLTAITHVYMDRYIGEIIDELALERSLKVGCLKMEAKLEAAKGAGNDRKNPDWLHPRERKNILVVATALRKLLNLADQMKVIDRLELKPGINRMDISLKGVNLELKLGFQQLIVRSVALKITNEWKDAVTILDEGQKWIPQKYGSVAKQAVSDLLGEGRKRGDYTITASQTQVKTDKEPLYNVRYYVMGLQTRPEEVKRTLEVLSDVLEGVELTKRDIKTLEDGWFWVLSKEGSKLLINRAYARPAFMTEEMALKVAHHKLSSTEAWKLAKKKTVRNPEEPKSKQSKVFLQASASENLTPRPPPPPESSGVNAEDWKQGKEVMVPSPDGRGYYDPKASSEVLCSCGAAIYGYSGGFIHCQKCHSLHPPTHDFTHMTGALEAEVMTPVSKAEVKKVEPLAVKITEPSVSVTETLAQIKVPLEPLSTMGRLCVILKRKEGRIWSAKRFKECAAERGWSDTDIPEAIEALLTLGILSVDSQHHLVVDAKRVTLIEDHPEIKLP